ncbi:MAG: hypothetical protein B7Y51_02935 [Burkholderiales bacterium 28-67-8]|nr:MAG: hypothetical protein B7Y51_02935 [Burkholderiales bacterium 28-67-8]
MRSSGCIQFVRKHTTAVISMKQTIARKAAPMTRSTPLSHHKPLALALAGAAAALAAPGAQAVIISQTGLHTLVPYNNADTLVGAPIVLTDIGGMTGVGLVNGGGTPPGDKGITQLYLVAFDNDDQITERSVAAGTLINASSVFNVMYVALEVQGPNLKGSGLNDLEATDPGYFGVTFDNGGGARYGWIDVALATHVTGTPFEATLEGWGYEDSGAGIQAGAVSPVPEPTTLTLMAMGLIGVGAMRRRASRDARAH